MARLIRAAADFRPPAVGSALESACVRNSGERICPAKANDIRADVADSFVDALWLSGRPIAETTKSSNASFDRDNATLDAAKWANRGSWSSRLAMADSIIVGPGPDQRSVRTTDRKVLRMPDDWDLLEPGDATITRRVKAAGPSYTVQERKGRKIFTRGVWAPRATIVAVTEQVCAERSTEQYAKRKAAGERRREKTQNEYVTSFRDAVLAFLAFDMKYQTIAEQLADAVAKHATPIGSGTVARTKRIPVERRAEAAVIAWLRHATTDYDHRPIARIRGERREVRRELARESRHLLSSYRRGESIDAATCPLQLALARKLPEPVIDEDDLF